MGLGHWKGNGTQNGSWLNFSERRQATWEAGEEPSWRLGTQGIGPERNPGGPYSIAAGVGLSIRMRNENQVVLCFFGDGPPKHWENGMRV